MVEETPEGPLGEGESRSLILAEIGVAPVATLVHFRLPERSLRAGSLAVLLEEHRPEEVLARASLHEILDLWDEVERRLDRWRSFWGWVIDAVRRRRPGGHPVFAPPRWERPAPALATAAVEIGDSDEVLEHTFALGSVLHALFRARCHPKACLALVRCALDLIRVGAGLRAALVSVGMVVPFSVFAVVEAVFESSAQRDGSALGMRLDEVVDLDERRARLAEDLLDFFLSTPEAVD